MTVELRKTGFTVNHKKVKRLLSLAEIKAIYPTKNNISNLSHKIYYFFKLPIYII